MNIITTKQQLKELVDAYLKVDAFAFDVETIGEQRGQPVVNDVVWISLATDERTDVIPMGHPNGEFLQWDKKVLLSGERKIVLGKELKETDYTRRKSKWKPIFAPAPEQLLPGEVFAALKPLFFSNKLKIGHNVKFDLKSIAKYYRGKVPSKPFFDTLMAAFIIDNSNRNSLGLDDVAEKYLKIQVVKGIGAKVEDYSFSDVAHYSGFDADVTWKLYKELSLRLVGSLQKVWNLEMDVVAALCDMELSGATMDVEGLKTLKKKLEEDIDKTKAIAWKLAGRPFSMNSVREKQKLLFSSKEEGGRGIKPQTRLKIALTTKGKKLLKEGKSLNISHISVSAEALELYSSKDELVDALITYQNLNKIMTTYVMPYLGGEVTRTTLGKAKIVEKKSLLINGKAYTNFKAHGAETGRFSSTDPNLQNIPSGGDYGTLVRNLFIAPKGYKLVVADYSQIEPRIIASFSQDPIALRYYREGKDLYVAIGDIMGVDRKVGKMLVLAISYGVGPEKISRSIGCSEKEAEDLIDQFSEEFPDIIKYKHKVVRMARLNSPVPYVETLFGRRRYLPELKSADKSLKYRAERQAFNTMIQGSAADLMKLALVRAHSCFVDEPNVNVILTVHDELVTVAREDLANDAAEAIRESMEGVKLPEIKVPLIADVKIVDRWGEAK